MYRFNPDRRHTVGMRFLVSMLFVSVLITGGLLRGAKGSDGALQDAAAARAFCASPNFQKLSCGWASDDEIAKTTSNQCAFCGTVWWGRAIAPQTLTAHPNYYQLAGREVSLACHGPVAVRAILKLVSDPIGEPDNCAAARLGAEDQTVTRCELMSPQGASVQLDEQSVTSAKDVNCTQCHPCDSGGCPMVAGRWYADSFTTTLDGCAGVQDVTKGYQVKVIPIVLNPGVTIDLAKFDVCSGSSC